MGLGPRGRFWEWLRHRRWGWVLAEMVSLSVWAKAAKVVSTGRGEGTSFLELQWAWCLLRRCLLRNGGLV